MLPFTVMMTQVMTVSVGPQAFGVPLDCVVEAVRVPKERIFRVGAARVFVFREKTVPIVELAEVLDVEGCGEDRQVVPVVVVRLGPDLAGLEVSDVGERIDVMLKPLDGLLSGARGVSGATLLGDGRVLVVLEPARLLA